MLAAGSVDASGLLVLGLPRCSHEAQLVVDELVRRGRSAALLWERAGHSMEDLPSGLQGLDQLAHVLTLNDRYTLTIRSVATGAVVGELSAAVPSSFFRSAERTEPGAGCAPVGSCGPDRYVAFFGRTHPSKGAERLVAAWRQQVIPALGVPLRLFLVDHFPTPSWAHEPTGMVTVHRLSGRLERASAMRAAAAVVFPAIYDHLPQALLESMAAGSLCVVTDIDGHGIVTPGVDGLVVSTDLSDLADTIGRAVSSPDALSGLRSEAQRTCAARHSPDRAHRTLRSLFGPAS